MAQLACGGQSLQAVGSKIAVAAGAKYSRPQRTATRMATTPNAARCYRHTPSRFVLPSRQYRSEGAETLPPKAYKQGELVKAMKGVAKLVTDPRLSRSSRRRRASAPKPHAPNIISGLLNRGYLLKKGRAVRASDAAFTLIDTVPAAIADPGTTAFGSRHWT